MDWKVKELILDYKLSREEYMEIQTYFMMRRSNIVKFCVALFGIGFVLLVSEIITGAKISGVWVLVVFPFPYIVYVAFKIRNIAYRMYENDMKEWHVCLSEQGISATAVRQKKNIEISWESVCKIWNNKKYTYLFFSKSAYLAIPSRAAKDIDVYHQYIQMAKRK